MTFLKAAASEVIGLFVGDWTQTIVSIVILAAGFCWLAFVPGFAGACEGGCQVVGRSRFAHGFPPCGFVFPYGPCSAFPYCTIKVVMGHYCSERRGRNRRVP